jgi:hypothetical protein
MSGAQTETPLILIPDGSGFPQIRNPTVGEHRLANNVEEVILGPLADFGESLDRERDRFAPADLHVFSENEERRGLSGMPRYTPGTAESK